MNYKFKKEQDTVTIEINLTPITRFDQPRVRLGMPDVIDIINNNFSFSNQETLGECLSPKYGLDNSYHKKCSGTWTFKILAPENAKPKVISKPKRATRSAKQKKAPRKSVK